MNQQLGNWIEIVADKCASNFKGLAKSTQGVRSDLMYIFQFFRLDDGKVLDLFSIMPVIFWCK